MIDDCAFVVYELRDPLGGVSYVGCTGNARSRHDQHAKRYPDLRFVIVARFMDGDDAFDYETQLIREHCPPLNHERNPERRAELADKRRHSSGWRSGPREVVLHWQPGEWKPLKRGSAA